MIALDHFVHGPKCRRAVAVEGAGIEVKALGADAPGQAVAVQVVAPVIAGVGNLGSVVVDLHEFLQIQRIENPIGVHIQQRLANALIVVAGVQRQHRPIGIDHVGDIGGATRSRANQLQGLRYRRRGESRVQQPQIRSEARYLRCGETGAIELMGDTGHFLPHRE